MSELLAKIEEKQLKSFVHILEYYGTKFPERFNIDRGILSIYREEILLMFLSNLILDIPVLLITEEDRKKINTATFSGEVSNLLLEKVNNASLSDAEKRFFLGLISINPYSLTTNFETAARRIYDSIPELKESQLGSIIAQCIDVLKHLDVLCITN